MNDTERREFRYFFINSSEKEIRARVETIEGLFLVEYPNPITETVYFTHGQKAAYAVPPNSVVRIRRYVSELSETIELGCENVFLEVKTNHTDRLNRKDRIVLPGITALSVLVKDTRSQSVSNILQRIAYLPPLFPTVATQVQRRHWIHRNGVRITLDKEIRVFAFLCGSLKGHYIESLGEGKLELKFPKSISPNESLVHAVTVDSMCVQKEQDYFERRLRECFFQNITKSSKH